MAIIQPDQDIGGYHILSFIGKGGMGEIWLARQTSIGREVALKILSPALIRKNPKFADRFIKEAQSAGRLNHPNIIAVHDVGTCETQSVTPVDAAGESGEQTRVHYFSMEFVDGENFREILNRDGPCDLETVQKVMESLADALAYAHSIGMIHRDIKPENVMITTDGRVKLADFGLAMQENEEDDVERDAEGKVKVMGTPLYMSPEQARGRSLDYRSDLYSLGATLFHLLTGRPPYRKNKSKEVMRAHVNDPVPDPSDYMDCPRGWRHLCMRLMAKSPDERASSPEEIKELVQAAVAGEKSPARRRHHPTNSRKRLAGNNAMIIVAAIIVIGAALVAFMPEGKPAANPVTPGNAAVNPGDGTDQSSNPAPEDTKLADARAFLASLPDNPREARQRLIGTEGLRNPYFMTSPPAMQLLEQRQKEINQRLQQELASARDQLRQRLTRINILIKTGDLITAASQLAEFSEADIRQVPEDHAETVALLESSREREITSTRTRIDRAREIDELEPILASVAARGLTEQQLQQLQAYADKRKQELERDATEQQELQRKNDRDKWDNFAAGVLQQRRGPNVDEPDYERIAVLAQSAGTIQTNPIRKRMDEIVQTAKRAQRVHQAIVNYLGESPHPIKLELTGNRAKITDFDNGRFTITIENPYGEIKHPITEGTIPVDAIVTAAITASGLGEPLTHRAAFAWMWDLPNAVALLSDVEQLESAQTRAIAALDPAVRRALSRINVSYDFTTQFDGWGSVFNGEGLSMIRGMARWEPTSRSPFTVADFNRNARQVINGMREAHLDTLIYSTTLAPPIAARIRLRLNDKSKAMVGFRRGSELVRVYLDYRNRKSALCSTDIGDRLNFSNMRSDDHRVTAVLDIELKMDEGNRLQYSINGQPVMPAAMLPGDAPIELVLQDLHLQDEEIGPIDIIDLSLEAERPR